MLVKAGDEWRKKSRGAEAVVEDFDLDLTAVGVPGELELDTQFGGARKGIGIVGKKNVGHIAADQSPEVRGRSEEHTSELQSLAYLVCRLLLEKKKTDILSQYTTLSRMPSDGLKKKP